MCMALNPYDGTRGLLGSLVGVLGEAVQVKDDGSFTGAGPTWADATIFDPRHVRYYIDHVGNSTDTADENYNVQNSGSGAVSTAAITPDSTHQLFRTISTGTSSAGRCARTYYFANFGSQIQLGASSSQHVFEIVFRVPTISDGTNTFVLTLGFFDTLTGASTDGLYIEVDSNADAQFQFITRANSVETKTDTGVTLNAGTWYRARVVITNNSAADCYIATEGSALGSAVAHHTTNIPNGNARVFSHAVNIRKTAGGVARTIDYLYQMAWHDRLAA